MSLLGLFSFLLYIYLGLVMVSAYDEDGQGTLHRRTFFLVGGSFVTQGNASISHGQMYVEHLVPAQVTQPFPFLFIHGNGMTGSNFLNTPDGRRGWADYFLSQGYEVYLVDQPARARSAWLQSVDGNQTSFDTVYIESHFTAPQRYMLWPEASLHTQWPGNGSIGDPIFDTFYKAIMPSLASDVESSMLIKAAGSQLLDKIGPVILVTHSQSGQFGWILADSRPSQVQAIIALEPIGPPFQNAVFTTNAARPFGLTELPLAFSPPIASAADLQPVAVSVSAKDNYTCFQQSRSPLRKLINLAGIPVLLVTSEASYHAVYDDCSVRFLRAAGVPVDHISLAAVGIRGNGHMFFMENNSLDIAENVIDKWLSITLREINPIVPEHSRSHSRFTLEEL